MTETYQEKHEISPDLCHHRPTESSGATTAVDVATNEYVYVIYKHNNYCVYVVAMLCCETFLGRALSHRGNMCVGEIAVVLNSRTRKALLHVVERDDLDFRVGAVLVGRDSCLLTHLGSLPRVGVALPRLGAETIASIAGTKHVNTIFASFYSGELLTVKLARRISLHTFSYDFLLFRITLSSIHLAWRSKTARGQEHARGKWKRR